MSASHKSRKIIPYRIADRSCDWTSIIGHEILEPCYIIQPSEILYRGVPEHYNHTPVEGPVLAMNMQAVSHTDTLDPLDCFYRQLGLENIQCSICNYNTSAICRIIQCTWKELNHGFLVIWLWYSYVASGFWCNWDYTGYHTWKYLRRCTCKCAIKRTEKYTSKCTWKYSI